MLNIFHIFLQYWSMLLQNCVGSKYIEFVSMINFAFNSVFVVSLVLLSLYVCPFLFTLVTVK